MRLDDWQFAAGGVRGADHDAAGTNSQDARAIAPINGGHGIVGIVCDGCSGAEHSEVGANMFANILASKIGLGFSSEPDLLCRTKIVLQEAKDAALSIMRMATWAMSSPTVANGNGVIEEAKRIVGSYFLFTTVGFAAYKDNLVLFSIGDGMVAVNGNVLKLPEWPGNKPPYMAYGLLPSRGGFSEEDLSFKIIDVHDLSSVSHFMIGSDGLGDLVAKQDCGIPTRPQEPIGPLEQFWKTDFLFGNKDGVRRRLAIINRPLRHPDWDKRQMECVPGPLRDDVTLIVGRRKPDGWTWPPKKA